MDRRDYLCHSSEVAECSTDVSKIQFSNKWTFSYILSKPPPYYRYYRQKDNSRSVEVNKDGFIWKTVFV